MQAEQVWTVDEGSEQQSQAQRDKLWSTYNPYFPPLRPDRSPATQTNHFVHDPHFPALATEEPLHAA
ncbi:hypothetical protein [Methylobacterium iners]|uniref:hypothetical protein n=1 Tax=Methylobacterium iners TaxID=418707 RepID=UPI001EE33AAF|nr:hypothetical protein [Methylobacterium iners]